MQRLQVVHFGFQILAIILVVGIAPAILHGCLEHRQIIGLLFPLAYYSIFIYLDLNSILKKLIRY